MHGTNGMDGMDGIDGIIDGIDGIDAMDGMHAHGMHGTHGNKNNHAFQPPLPFPAAKATAPAEPKFEMNITLGVSRFGACLET